MSQFLNAKDVAYDRPGSVSNYYGWTPATINSVYSRATGDGSTKNQQNIAKHVSKFLDKRGQSMDTAKPNMMVHAMDYAYREEGRKQQTKGSGFLDFLKSAIGPVVGSLVLPGIGSALGAGISAGVGGAIGGAIQGGISKGPLGALTGAASGYGIGSGVGAAKGWAGNALGSTGGFTNPGALGLEGSNLSLPGLANAPGTTVAAGIGNPAGVIGSALGNAASGFLPGMEGWAQGLYNPQSMGGPASGRNVLGDAARFPVLGMGGQAQGQNAAPGGAQAAQGPTAPGFASVPSAQPGTPQGQGFDATLMSAAGKMPQNALAMNSMGPGGLGMSDRDRYRNPGYQPPPFANFLRM